MASPRDISGSTWTVHGEEAGPAPSAAPELVDLGPIGAGGGGEVRRVHDTALRRTLALKRLHPEMQASAAHLARFLDEARVTASLEHPGVVPVHALGTDKDGRFYFTMKEVRGRTLADAIRAGEPRERLVEAFRRVCETVAFAHARGVVHRDLKPQNIMLGEFGEVYVLDWGLARAEPGAGEARAGPATQHGTMLGSPGYMSPEHVSGRSGAIDARSDVWSLGAVLHEIFAGRPPIDVSLVHELLDRTVSATLDPLPAHTPPELAAVVTRAMARAPADRYPSARELADDVGAWLAGAPVRAYRYGLGTLLRRWVLAHRGVVAASLLGLAGVLAVGTWAAVRVTAERDQAREHLADNLLRRADLAIREGIRPDADLLAARALELGETPEARGALMAARALPAPELLREIDAGTPCEWVSLDSGALCGGWSGLWRFDGDQPLRLAPEGTYSVNTVRRGEVLAVVGAGGRTVEWRSAADGSLLGVGEGNRALLTELAFDPEGALYAGDAEGNVLRWTADRARDGAWRIEAPVVGLAAGRSAVWAADAHGVVHRLEGPSLVSDHKALVLAGSPDGAWLVAAGGFTGDPRLRVWDTARAAEVPGPVPGTAAATALAWSPDGRQLATADETGLVQLWSPGTWSRRAAFRAHPARVMALAFDASGQRLLTADRDGLMRVWGLSGTADERLLGRHPMGVLSVDFAGEELLSFGLEGSARIWRSGREQARVDVVPPSSSEAAWSEEASTFAVGDGTGVLVAGRDGAALARLPVGTETRDLLFSGDEIVTFSGKGAITWWRDATRLATLPAPLTTGDAWSIVRSPAGDWFAAAMGDGRIHIVDAASKTVRVELDAATMVFGLDVSADGKLLAGAGHSGAVLLWDTTTWTRSELAGHARACGAVAFAPGNGRLVSAAADGSVRLWDVDRRATIATIPAAQVPISALDSTADGRAFAAGAADGAVRLWPLADLALSPEDAVAEATARFGRAR